MVRNVTGNANMIPEIVRNCPAHGSLNTWSPVWDALDIGQNKSKKKVKPSSMFSGRMGISFTSKNLDEP